MDSNGQYPYNVKPLSHEEHDASDRLSAEQLRRLVHLLDNSDVSEIEVKHAKEGTRLVLRKAKALEHSDLQTRKPVSADLDLTPPVEAKHTVVAPLVGIFHTWARPRGGALVGSGDYVKVGQLVGTIQSLNVINEVESSVAGHVVEILVQDGEAVEYGQPLVVIERSQES